MFKNKRHISLLVITLLLSLILALPVLAEDYGEMTLEKQTAFSWLDENAYMGEEVATYIWYHPELGLAEHKSSAVLQDFLAQKGFEIEAGVANMDTAFVASWGSGKPVIGIHAEFDALPGLSQKLGSIQREEIVKGAPGHGCGHNLFGAYSALAGIAIKEALEKHGIEGTIKVYGTPAEETVVGKAFFVKYGIYDDADVVLSWHPGGRNSVSWGSTLAMDNFKVSFKGIAAHGASAPWEGRSALDAVELMNIGMNYMREHVRPESRIMYIVSDGGAAPNVVPPYAEVHYFVRAPRYQQVAELMEWTKEIARGAAIMTQTELEFKSIVGVWEYLPNEAITRVGDANIRLVGAPPFTDEDQAIGAVFSETMGITEGPFYKDTTTHPDLDTPFKWATGGGSIDEANTSWVVPMVRFSGANKSAGIPGHSWQQVAQIALEPAFKGSLTVSKYIAGTALDLYQHQEVIDAAWEELISMNEKHGPFFDPVADVDVPSVFLTHGIEEDAMKKQWEVAPYPYPEFLLK